MTKYFGTDGVRGRVDEKLTVEMAYRIGRFIGQYPDGKRNRIVISRDTRISGKKLLDALIEGIRLSGGHVYDEGVSTTPSISYIVESKGFDYGIMISASHNPFYDNGIKIFDAKGKKLSSDIEELIEVYMDSPTDFLPQYSGHNLGKLIEAAIFVKNTSPFSSPKPNLIFQISAFSSIARTVRLQMSRRSFSSGWVLTPNLLMISLMA